MSIVSILQQQVESRPDAAAIIDTQKGRSRIMTFVQLDRASAQGAEMLLREGLKSGDAVLVLHPMSADLYVTLVAIFRLRLLAMFLDPSAGRDHIERCCEICPPRAFIGSAKAHLLRLWSPALRRIPLKLAVGASLPGAKRWEAIDRLPPSRHQDEIAEETPALLTFTSGSTGKPKAAVRTHGFLLAQHRALAESFNLTAGEIDLATMPIVLLANLASGVTSLIPNCDLRQPGGVNPGPVVAEMQEKRVVSSVASPAFFERLARCCSERKIELTHVKKLFTGGAPVFPRVLDQMQRMAPKADIVAVYGSTEAEPIAHVSRAHIKPEDSEAMMGGGGLLAGHPVDSIHLRVLQDYWGKPIGPFTDDNFSQAQAAAGVPGEIVVNGPHVLTGYLHGEGDHETKFKVGDSIWHRTGDAGYLDASGRLWLLGRCSARVDDSRGQLYPFAAETALYRDARIKRAAVVKHKGSRVLAIESYDGKGKIDFDAIRKTLAWAGIDEIRRLKTIPMDKRHNAKIDYPALFRLLDSRD